MLLKWHVIPCSITISKNYTLAEGLSTINFRAALFKMEVKEGDIFL